MLKNKISTFIIFTGFISSCFSQIHVKISGNIFNAPKDTVKISQIMDNKYVDYLKAIIDKKGNYSIEGKVPSPDYYIIRIKDQQVNLILRDKSDIKVHGDAKKLGQFHNIVNSDESIKLNELVREMQIYNSKRDSASIYLKNHPDQEQAVNQSFSRIYYEFVNYKNVFLRENENSPALLPLLSSTDTEKEFPLYEAIVSQLVNGFGESPTIKQVKAQYEQIKIKKDEMSFLDPGKVAPDFSQTKADGTTMKLSDLKGKVVLLDFWASWCGPCRKENPNVVKLYEKYNKDGFTVMSVSLDKEKQSWLNAIEKDHLLWPNHVSDLKFWSNEAARLYKVTGIPFTVLIDQEGKIIDKNLRGEDLDNKLKSLFGH